MSKLAVIAAGCFSYLAMGYFRFTGATGNGDLTLRENQKRFCTYIKLKIRNDLRASIQAISGLAQILETSYDILCEALDIVINKIEKLTDSLVTFLSQNRTLPQDWRELLIGMNQLEKNASKDKE